jgi:thiopurine S-methyltransferase
LKYLPDVLGRLKKDVNISVFVPLCGKTLDMVYLATTLSAKVVGVEGVPKAIDEFIIENPSLQIIKPTLGERNEPPKFSRYLGTNIELLTGDFFKLLPEDVSSIASTAAQGEPQLFDLVWDRGSMVAIEPKLRDTYVKVLSRLVRPGGIILLSAFDRRSGTEEAKKGGPPFSLNETQIRELYEKELWVESVTFLGEKDDMEEEDWKKRWTEAGKYGILRT